MAYTLEEFCKDAHQALKSDPGNGGREKVRDLLAKLLQDQEFVNRHCSPDAKPGRILLYRDPELGFDVLAHCFKGGAKSPPHDHGTSWAIYGQALGHTDVEVWQRKDDAVGVMQDGAVELEQLPSYRLNQGDVGVFHPGMVHTVDFTPGSRYIRVTGKDLEALVQGVYDIKKQIVRPGNPGASIKAQSM